MEFRGSIPDGLNLRSKPMLPLLTSQEDELAELAFSHLTLRLGALNRALACAVTAQSVRGEIAQSEVAPCVTNERAQTFLAEIYSLQGGEPAASPFIVLSPSEMEEQDRLRRAVARAGDRLPFDRLAEELELHAFELDVVTLCAAAQMDRSYGRLFGFIVDNLNRQAPSVELLCGLGAPRLRERLARRRTLASYARLRRSGLVTATENHEQPLHTTLALHAEALARLTQPGPWGDRFFDPDLVVDDPTPLGLFSAGEALARLAESIRLGTIQVCGVWGNTRSGVRDAVGAVALAASRSLFRLPPDPSRLEETLAAAAQRRGVVWLDVDPLASAPDGGVATREQIGERLARTELPVCLSGEFPWRPLDVLVLRNYSEARLGEAPGHIRQRLWTHEMPELAEAEIYDATARFRLSPRQVRTVARVARSAAAVCGPRDGNLPAALDEACTQITQPQGMRFARQIEPKRGPDDLVLPADLHRQVLEVPRFYRTLLRVDEEWGFRRIATGGGGIKVLFTGDSGTGKTLAAEVIAGQLRLGLMKVDLSQLVSKWVGETEKNLESCFSEAEHSQAVLFLDEADTLCGKRGHIHNGSDRYANLEVGFLLQRLEQYGGLCILATNLSDEMDTAFVRRFQVVLHFPRPKEPERRRLWQIAFPQSAPLDPSVDFEPLLRLDLTGAGIMGAARMAALLAADTGGEVITYDHLAEGIRRQFQQEARLLNPNILNPQIRSSRLRR